MCFLLLLLFYVILFVLNNKLYLSIYLKYFKNLEPQHEVSKHEIINRQCCETENILRSLKLISII